MSDSSASARAADSSSTHKYPWRWSLKDLANVPKNGRKVFSCFSCGGGSSMGYKLAGFEVIGNVEIDPKVMAVYKANNHPRYSYEMDVRDFVKLADLPPELYQLDILDGSPPCSVFSTAGDREAAWGKEKVFREGQARQRLDDLFIHFIEIARKLQPRVVVAENVSGLIKGNARGYVNEIFKAFDDAGYKPQLFLLEAKHMGVPQLRPRTFFIAQRKDQGFPKLTLSFKEPAIPFGEIRSAKGTPLKKQDGKMAEALRHRLPTDYHLGMINQRLYGKKSNFNSMISSDDKPAYTLTASAQQFRMCDGDALSKHDVIAVQTFPYDYDFGDQPPQFICGMSVPPVMMAQVASEIDRQWFQGDK